jgi:site-specific DNA recombinase
MNDSMAVVYKIDHLSRSLADFARMVDVFDRHRVRFSAVTHRINSAASMGRLMLNVLLSFAQFERKESLCRNSGVWRTR